MQLRQETSALRETGGPQAVTSSAVRTLPRRHPGRWVAALAVAIVLAVIVKSLVSNERFQWPVVGKYLFSEVILAGLLRTLLLALIAVVGGLALGVVLAIMRMSSNPLVSGSALAYVWFFRSSPMLVQIIFWNYLAILYPRISIHIPFGPTIFSASATSVITPFLAAVLAFVFKEAAYFCEIIRAGILSVDTGQVAAAKTLGMTPLKMMRRVVLPQATRVIIPPAANEAITVLKLTSLVSVIAMKDLLYTAQLIYQASFQIVPLLMVATIWYLIVVSVLMLGQNLLEKRYGRAYQREKTTRRMLSAGSLRRARGR